MENQDKSFFCNCLFFSSGAFARGMAKLGEEAFAKTGMSSSYAFVVLVVNQFPDGVSPSHIAKELFLTPSTVTRLLDKLATKGYVERSYEGKTTTVKLTSDGKAKTEELLAAWNVVFEKYTEVLGEEKVSQLSGLIQEAVEKL